MASSIDDPPVWFITGCSTGLGRALAERVLQHGHRVAVTARNPARIEDLVAAYPDARRAEIASRYGKQPVDPVRAAEAIIQVFESHSPPLNLIRGKDALDRVRAKLDQLMTSIDDWEAITLGADFPRV